jgi:hypothetical protein
VSRKVSRCSRRSLLWTLGCSRPVSRTLSPTTGCARACLPTRPENITRRRVTLGASNTRPIASCFAGTVVMLGSAIVQWSTALQHRVYHCAPISIATPKMQSTSAIQQQSGRAVFGILRQVDGGRAVSVAPRAGERAIPLVHPSTPCRLSGSRQGQARRRLSIAVNNRSPKGCRHYESSRSDWPSPPSKDRAFPPFLGFL